MADSTLHVSRLHDAAKRNCYGMVPCNWMYRNKGHTYFSRIEASGGVMRTQLKDDGGDPRSPINGKLRGLFFMANNDMSGEPPDYSFFGPVRIQIKSDELFRLAPNLYFADFYCMGTGYSRKHYVILVMTKTGSSADLFCRQNLVPLDTANNPFLYTNNGRLYYTCSNLMVEVFYTANLNITELQSSGKAIKTTVMTQGRGHSTRGGKPKNPSCPTCNVSPITESREPVCNVSHTVRPRELHTVRPTLVSHTASPYQGEFWGGPEPNRGGPKPTLFRPATESRQPENSASIWEGWSCIIL